MRKLAVLVTVLTSVFLVAQAAEQKLVEKKSPDYKDLAVLAISGEEIPANIYLEAMTCTVTKSSEGNVANGTKMTIYRGNAALKALRDAQEQNDIIQANNAEVIVVNGKTTLAELTVDAQGYLSVISRNKSLGVKLEWKNHQIEYSLSDFEGRVGGRGVVECN